MPTIIVQIPEALYEEFDANRTVGSMEYRIRKAVVDALRLFVKTEPIDYTMINVKDIK